MQAIAAENNLSETAFFVPRGRRLPAALVHPERPRSICAATRRWPRPLSSSAGSAPQRDRGDVSDREGRDTDGRPRRRALALDFPSRPPLPCPMSPDLGCRARQRRRRRCSPRATTSRSMSAPTRCRGANARFRRDRRARPLCRDRHGARASRTASISCRAFSRRPRACDEDPVTGSAHCTLIPYWADRLGKTRLEARQLSRRGGALSCALRGDRVTIAGRAILYLEGTITI